MGLARILGASTLYSVCLLAAGWILGPLRVLMIEPRVGAVAAVWLEAPLMALAILLAARWVSRTFALGQTAISRLLVGLTALSLVVAAEIIGGQLFRGRTVGDSLQGWIALAGWPLLGLYLLLLLAPWLFGSGAGRPTPTGAGSGPAHFPKEGR